MFFFAGFWLVFYWVLLFWFCWVLVGVLLGFAVLVLMGFACSTGGLMGFIDCFLLGCSRVF